MEARFLKTELERVLGAEVFLDSDDLKDLRKLGEHVVDSDVLVLLQSAEVLLRPWCVYELVTAIKADVPIVAVTVASKNYDFAEAGQLMLHLDTLLDVGNPGAKELLSEIGVDLKRAAWMLSSVVPSTISVKFDPSGSQNSIFASILDLVDAMRAATVISPEKTLDEWLGARGETLTSEKPHGDSENGARRLDTSSIWKVRAAWKLRSAWTPRRRANKNCASIPTEVPDLPKGYLVRETILSGIKELLFPSSKESEGRAAAETAAETPTTLDAQPVVNSSSKSAVVAVQGMGGSGKTVTAAALVFDPAVNSRFDLIVFLPFGQNPIIRDLQNIMLFQLVGKTLDAGISNEEILETLVDAASGKNVLAVLDDVWSKEAYHSFGRVLDQGTTSRLVVTTRVKGLVPGAAEFELGLLSPEDSVSLLLECAGETATKPYSPILFKTVELCSHLPLVIAIAAVCDCSFSRC